MGANKPCAIHQGWGLQRTANGELASRAIAMLSLLTGSVGVSGGSTGARESDINIPFVRFPTVPNPVKPLSRCSCGQTRFIATMK